MERIEPEKLDTDRQASEDITSTVPCYSELYVWDDEEQLRPFEVFGEQVND